MKRFVQRSAILLLFAAATLCAMVVDMQDDISALIKAGNSKELAKYFSPSVTITVLDDENSYQKAQAEVVLKDFFSKHSPLSVKPLHKLSSNPNYKFTVLLLHTNNGDYRVSFSLKNSSAEFLLTEIRFEANKE